MLSYLPDHLLPGAREAARRVLIAAVDRRSVLKGGIAAFALGLFTRPSGAFESYPTGGLQMPRGIVADPLVFVSIDPDGTVTIVAHRSEMGQGSRTSLPMVLADELDADWSRVRILQAPGDEPRYGNQDTDGSRSLRHHIQPMRQMGAAVREMLRRAAAKSWGVEPAAVTVEFHTLKGPDGQSADFGELAEAAMAELVPSFEDLTFKDEAAFRYIGKGEVQITDLHDITTGKAIYGADVRLNGMKVAVIARPPVLGGKVKSYDASETLAVPGVERVIEIAGAPAPVNFLPLGGIAVVATNTWAAERGRERLKIEWDDGPHASYESAAYRAEMEEASKAPDKIFRDQGDVPGAFAAASTIFERSYYQAHMAHIPMEPPVAIASVTTDGCEIWTSVQSPYGAREDVAKDLALPIEQVKVNVTLLGGGFGRKSKWDFAIEAARLSKAVNAPVRVQWTREDDIHNSFMHTTSVERLRVAMDDAGKVTGWHHTSVAPSILSTFAPDNGHQFFIENGMGHVDAPWDVANIRCDNAPALAHARIGWFRSVSNVPRAWAVQSFIAELAHELGRDHKEMLLELIGPPRTIDVATAGMPEDFWNYGEPYAEYPIDTGRLAHVVEVAADAAGWGATLPEGEGLGLAVHRSFVTYVAVAARVRIVDGQIRVPEMHFAVDCGFAANPERIRSQMEGSAVMGMTLALNSGITFADGRVQQSNFHDYDVARADNFPEKVEVHIVPHPFSVHASGIGEPGVPPVAPAMGNAIFAATGRRLRDLPLGTNV
ncbi:molybdopterin-dependent oxidoreductase [Limibaculum sp. FT325]|uniref:xanthine dehydrogenase family protein molybdopterin-binding subunit n=1 Tax=Thermohalobaculum sediminis TaxID=2939436 RepID=UPI0020BFBAD9|nr:molybdopterin cofactor-binding domain-containing protein [Limibaculum sediminis]MCL5778698.1 molybdopterin-dependent oxidoreductase [Limibaculum sediminis]